MLTDKVKVLIRSGRLITDRSSLLEIEGLVGKAVKVETPNSNVEKVSATFIISEVYLYSRLAENGNFLHLRLYSGDALRVELKIRDSDVDLCSFASRFASVVGELKTNLIITEI
jgi:hypothetical protein